MEKEKSEEEKEAEKELQILINAYETRDPKDYEDYEVESRRLCQGEMQRFCQLMKVNNCN